jgi:hypothetical protein
LSTSLPFIISALTFATAPLSHRGLLDFLFFLANSGHASRPSDGWGRIRPIRLIGRIGPVPAPLPVAIAFVFSLVHAGPKLQGLADVWIGLLIKQVLSLGYHKQKRRLNQDRSPELSFFFPSDRLSFKMTKLP